MRSPFHLWGQRRIAAFAAGTVAVVAGCFALVASCTGGNGEEAPEKYLSGTVQIGVFSDHPGWGEYKNGVWDGFDIALANWLAEELHFTPRFVPITSRERLLVLQEETGNAGDDAAKQNIKLVIANFSITDRRRESIDFAGPYLSDSQGLVTRADSTINSRDDLEGKTVCVPLGSTTETRLFDMRIVPAPENTTQRCVERLREGSVDAVSTDTVVLEGLLAHSRTKDLRLAPQFRRGSELYGIGLPNNRPKLCEYLTAKLVEFINGQWDQKFRDKLPGVSLTDRKPNSGALDPCEPPATAVAVR